MRRLCDHFARDHLAVEELERRLDAAYAARGPRELEAALAGLPALPERGDGEAAAVAWDPSLAAAEHDLLVAVMAGTERKGGWTPPRRLTVLAVMGGVEVDFREAVFAVPVTEVRVFALMGGAEVLVPPGVRVEVRGAAVMGGFGHTASESGASPDAPLVRITGFALMGGVDVKVRRPGESEREARRRRRAARKALRARRRS